MDKLMNSKFFTGIQNLGGKMGNNKYLQAISGGLMGTMAITMIGAVMMILTSILQMLKLITPASQIYSTLMMPYNMTMGMISLYTSFTIAYVLARSLKINPLANAIVSASIFLMVAAPSTSYKLEGGGGISAIPTSNLSAVGLFTAILVALLSVRITKFCLDKKIVIHLPDSVPGFLGEAFKSILPFAINTILFLGVSIAVNNFTGMSLPIAITTLLSYPLQGLTSFWGILLVTVFALLLWAVGIHGSMLAYLVLMVPYMQVITANADLVAAGNDPVYNPLLLRTVIGILGGTGNTLALIILTLRSKSSQLKAVSRASFIPGLFNINEPAIFGFPITYNPILAIPFILNPLILMVLYHIGYAIGLLTPPYILIQTPLPVGLLSFFSTMSPINLIWDIAMIFVGMIIWYPFVKTYEKQLIDKEKTENKQELEGARI
ncbi:MAG TPA: PTS sugar transporter subunit IIC [Clostridiales bacterium]|nr:PTS sugar transporter subunit IIC [Clostridiales bacterium]